MLAKKTVKNQITLPKVIVQQLPDVDYFDVSVREGEVVVAASRVGQVDVPHLKNNPNRGRNTSSSKGCS